MSRKTIGENPLDLLVLPAPEEAKERPQKKKKLNENDSQKLPGDIKQKLTIQISEDIVERAKNAVYWTRGLTLAQLTEQALEKAIKTLEKNNVIYDDKTGQPLKEKGDKFPKRREELKSGRPVN